ncbi:MAG: citrate/2-methylcitrate synthase [Spirochaetia bacterium]|nr:citrate/2-methylcitrate synthase [Spirochaetia bacterium]
MDIEKYVSRMKGTAVLNNTINPALYAKYNTKRGLRNSDGSGVVVGLSQIGDAHGYIFDEGTLIPDEGRLTYRGVLINDIVNNVLREKRHGFEETVYFLLFGEFPSSTELDEFNDLLDSYRNLPPGFTEDMIMKAPSNDVMNKLARSVLASYSYDSNADDVSIENVLRQCIILIARFPTMIAHGYEAKAHYHEGKSLFIHNPAPKIGTAANFLRMIRPDKKYTELEATVLDIALILHAEHGGGNNSTFTNHVVTSAYTDTYSAIAAALCSMKGPKHGGANIKVVQMMENIMENVHDWNDDDEIVTYLKKILRKEVFDKAGLIYGYGHAIYTKSDPRAILLKETARSLASEKGFTKELNLFENVERLAGVAFNQERNSDRVLCVNVDFYSGFVYRMLNIPTTLYTPIFALARVAGWSAHRIEELVSGGKLIRPAYRVVSEKTPYISIKDRK